MRTLYPPAVDACQNHFSSAFEAAVPSGGCTSPHINQQPVFHIEDDRAVGDSIHSEDENIAGALKSSTQRTALMMKRRWIPSPMRKMLISLGVGQLWECPCTKDVKGPVSASASAN
eukprot:3506354-Pleurochrysis_carterae.AAC.3